MSWPPVCASASAITPSTKAVTSLACFGAAANHVVLQRAQRTVRPAEPTEAGSIRYEVAQFGQTINMGTKGVTHGIPERRT